MASLRDYYDRLTPGAHAAVRRDPDVRLIRFTAETQVAMDPVRA